MRLQSFMQSRLILVTPQFQTQFYATEIPHMTPKTGSIFCIGGDSLFVKTGEGCIHIELATGKKLAEYKTPISDNSKNRAWGYLAYCGGTLFGTVATCLDSIETEAVTKTSPISKQSTPPPKTVIHRQPAWVLWIMSLTRLEHGRRNQLIVWLLPIG